MTKTKTLVSFLIPHPLSLMNQPTLPPEAPESLLVEVEPRTPSPITLVFRELSQDRAYQLLLSLVLLANLALFVYLALRFANLPDLLPLHFDSAGLPDRIDSKNSIFALPVIGLTVLFLNTSLGILLYRQERAVTLLLAVGALFVQLLIWLAVINIAGIV